MISYHFGCRLLVILRKERIACHLVLDATDDVDTFSFFFFKRGRFGFNGLSDSLFGGGKGNMVLR